MQSIKNKIPTFRDNFSQAIKDRLAKRAGAMCSICRATTIGPSFESITSLSNVGVAAHITAAAKNGPRYDRHMTSQERASISNGIWLCQLHQKLIDDDIVTWTTVRLLGIKEAHEKYVSSILGLPQKIRLLLPTSPFNEIKVKEYAFMQIIDLKESYKDFIKPILQHNQLKEDATIGVLLCGSEPGTSTTTDHSPPWTVFVKAGWLNWLIQGQEQGFQLMPEIGAGEIYGRIPGWPDSFFEFLSAMVQTNTSFEWTLHKGGYPILVKAKTGS